MWEAIPSVTHIAGHPLIRGRIQAKSKLTSRKKGGTYLMVTVRSSSLSSHPTSMARRRAIALLQDGVDTWRKAGQWRLLLLGYWSQGV